MIRHLRGGKRVYPVDFTECGNKQLKVRFGWAPGSSWIELKDEIKAMRGARFKKEDGQAYWLIDDCDRNNWTLDYLDIQTPSPYKHYDQEFPELLQGSRDLFEHQKVMLTLGYYLKRMIWAAEMGTGKTLSAIELMELVRPKLAWYVAPKFALHAIAMEFNKWNAKIRPFFVSYDGMKKIMKNWEEGRKAPDMVFFDESAYLKTPGSQRSQYAQALADGMRADHSDPYIILMSGAPAPKSPEDWWKQCEIACPGFLKEGHPIAFKNRLALIVKETSFAGGSYPKLITWFDDEHKCKECGEFEEAQVHQKIIKSEDPNLSDMLAPPISGQHDFVPSINEVQKLYKRLKGLVFVQFKKDCLNLPDKVYREVVVEMDAATKRAMNTIINTSPTTIQALTRLRELSDGFQYRKTVDDSQQVECSRCKGTGVTKEYEPEREVSCPKCDGTGYVGREIKETVKAKTPKDKALVELLEENDPYRRIVIYSGFTASIDRIVDLCQKQDWAIIRVDKSRIWTSFNCPDPFLAFQDKEKFPQNIAIVANQASLKTAHTFTADNMIIYWSNTFVGDDRIQSEDRIHRIGMDMNLGATIVDILHLPTDKYVLDNVKLKKRLQGITLGEFQRGVQEYIKEAA